jgi:predicted metal-dependent phosphoesterase TrpH
MFCDLHMHSTASDGTDAPSALPALAAAHGLSAIALTDHDTTAGLPACAAACEAAGIAFVPGIEVSADPAPARATHRLGTPLHDDHAEPLRFGTLHILGLFIRHDDAGLLDIHHRMVEARLSRNPAIVHKLREMGVDIEYEEVEQLAQSQGTTVIGRPHIAQVLMKKGYVKSIQDAFRKYIGAGAQAYVRRDPLDPHHAIDAIHTAGGLAILAHPIQLRCAHADDLEHAVTRLKAMGLDGIETQHCDHHPHDVEQYAALADKLELLTTGGSDYHGTRKGVDLNSERVPLDRYEQLRDAAGI